MTAVVTWYLIGALAGLTVVLLVAEAFSDASALNDAVLRLTLADIDSERGEP